MKYSTSPKAVNVSTAAFMFKILVRKLPHVICLPINVQQDHLSSKKTDPHKEEYSRVVGKNDEVVTAFVAQDENCLQSENAYCLSKERSSGSFPLTDTHPAVEYGNHDDHCSFSNQEEHAYVENNLPTGHHNKANDETVSTINKMTFKLNSIDQDIPHAQAYRLLFQLLLLLRSQVNIAIGNLLQAAIEAPMHGLLYCIRGVLCDFELR